MFALQTARSSIHARFEFMGANIHQQFDNYRSKNVGLELVGWLSNLIEN